MKNQEEEFKQIPLEPKQQQNISRLGINFGSLLPNDSIKSSCKVSIKFCKEEAEKQIVHLMKCIKNKQDPNYAALCEFFVPPEYQTLCLETLQNIYGASHQLTELNQAIAELLSSQQLKIDHFLDPSSNKIYLILKLGQTFEEIAISQVKLFTFLGLEKVFKENKNSIEINLSSKNSMSNILQMVKNQNQSLLSALLQQISFEILMKTSPDIINDLFNVLESMGLENLDASNKGAGFSALVLLLKKMKRFDIDLQLQSSEKLDEAFRKRFLDSVLKFNKVKIDKGDEKNYRTLMKCVQGDILIYFTISEIGAIKINISLPEFLELFNFYAIGI